MTWRRVGAIYALLAVLVGYLVVVELRPPPPPDPATDPTSAARSLLGVTPDTVTRVAFRRGDTRVIATHDGDRWTIVEPRAVAATSDLIAALVATLTAGQVADVMAEGAAGNLDAFGLAAPAAEIEVTLRDPPETTARVLLGGTNPTRTALYAKRADAPTVYLVGLNVRYYLDLVFAAAAGAEPSPAR